MASSDDQVFSSELLDADGEPMELHYYPSLPPGYPRAPPTPPQLVLADEAAFLSTNMFFDIVAPLLETGFEQVPRPLPPPGRELVRCAPRVQWLVDPTQLMTVLRGPMPWTVEGVRMERRLREKRDRVEEVCD